MRFQCSHCKGIVAIDDSECGNPVGCGNCGSVTTVPETRFSPSAVINDFVIKKVIGHGGMGQVFLAHQMSLDRPVALKILMEQFSTDSEFIVDFVKEARAAARLNHPNIVQSYAVGEEDGIYFFAMEYVEGETLTDLLRRNGALDIERGINIIQQIGEALDFAWKHQQLVHRDVKPDNIMLTNRGVAKLADLGLARVASELLEDMEDDEVMGTPQYICPEQLLGQPMDIRGDIYSLGATFYQAITGNFPFEGKSAAEIARKHLQEPLRPPHEVGEQVPESVSFIIQKMMAKKAEDRYPDGTQLANDLNLVLRGEAPAGFTGKKGLKPATGKAKPALAVAADDDADEEVPEAASPGTSDESDESDAGSDGPKLKLSGKKKKTKTKLKLGDKKKTKTLSLNKGSNDSDDGEPAAKAVSTATSAGTKQLSPLQKGGKSKGPMLLILGVAAILVIAVIGGISWYVMQSAKYSPESLEQAQALYFSVEGANAEEQEAYERLEPFIGALDQHLEDIPSLNQAVALAYKFESDYPNSIFNQSADNIDYGDMFGSSMFADQIRPYAEKMANLVPRTRAVYEEQLIRQLRNQRHQEETQQTAERAEELETEAKWEQARQRIEQYIRQRQNELRRQLTTLTNDVQRKQELLQSEQQDIRRTTFTHTTEHDYREALLEIRKKLRDKSGYGISIAPRVQVITREDEFAEARGLLRELQRNYRDLEDRRLTDEVRGAINTSELDQIKQEMSDLIEQEEMLFLTREAWFEDLRESVEKAQEYWQLVANTENKLEGQKVDTKEVEIKGMEQLRVNYISADSILLHKKELNAKGEYETKGTATLPLSELELKEFQELAELSFGQGNPDDYALMQGAFFHYLGGFKAAGAELEKAGGQLADFLTSEVEPAQQIMRALTIDKMITYLKRQVEAGQLEKARRDYQQRLKPRYGTMPEFQERESEMQEVLQLTNDD